MTDISPLQDTKSAAPKKRGRPRKVTSNTATDAAPKDAVPKKVVSPRTRKVTPKVVESAVQRSKPQKQPASQLAYLFEIGRRKRAVARVFAYKEGKGEIEVNGKSLAEYFRSDELVQLARESLEQSPLVKTIRLVIQLRGGGLRGQAEAVRLGVARALIKLEPTLQINFRARGYLTRDPREKERKKPGLKRARRAPQWQKR
ncbi:30S ribosomal protein S9 [Candidatus Uhrbacteria bacterium]|nr:30S ribosomal protein S9 [Candidatus Uhrbacteria bacterium]